MRILKIAVLITLALVTVLIFIIFSLKLSKKIKRYFSQRSDEKIYRILSAFEKGKFEKYGYEQAKLKGANFWGADLKGANLSKADLRKANFFGANLEGTNLKEADLEEANLSGANLQGSDLSFANLKAANLQAANLNGANLFGTNLERANLEGAQLERAIIDGAEFIGRDIKQRQKALKKLKKMRQNTLLRAFEISKKDFSEETTQEIIKIALDKNIPNALGKTLLNTRIKKWRRVQAAYQLTNFGGRAVYYLSEAIESKDSDISFNSAQALSFIKSEESFEILLYLLPRLKQFSQSRIAHLLQNYVDTGFNVLVKAREDKEPIIRYWTAYLLGRFKSKDSLDLLLKMVDDPNDNVRANAAQALGSLGFKEAYYELEGLLDDRAWFVRNHAVKSLKELGIKQAAGKIASLLRDKNWWVRENATGALISFGRECINFLLPMLDDEDKFAKNRAGEILERLGFVDEKIQQLRSEPKNKKVFNLLKKIRLAGATHVFEKYLKGDDKQLKNQAERLLAA